jgi:hypothetical protein
MAAADGAPTVDALRWAARLDPGSYRVRLRLAEAAARAGGGCALARAEARAAARLLPAAPAPRRVLARCGGR